MIGRPGEHPLAGGNASGAVRVGDTVRKPWTPTTGRVAAFMDTVRSAGVDVPRHRGRDGYGRQVLEWIPGRSAMEIGLDRAGLARVGRMVRAVHEASPGYDPADGTWEVLLPAPAPDLICHNDLSPWNLVVGERWVFVDWDGAGPSSRGWDLAYAAQTFALNDPGEEPASAADRLRAFVDGYGADTALRAALPDAMAARAAAMRDLLAEAAASGREPWAAMHGAGHGAHWSAATAYVGAHRAVWAAALG
ncbi:phosphotransferase [Pseudolysinimonas sp.]|uniref:phosphotransferase n=1 Tax=Pseudolysinimonas sp. TaxID=2680009 RepID=UPI003F7F0976